MAEAESESSIMREAYKAPSAGRMQENAAGLGVPSPEQVEERARELAVIQGRAASEVTDADRAQAKRELLGEVPTDPHNPEEMIASVTSWSEEPGSAGTQAATYLPQDEANLGERLVEEGMDEALHDEMLEARKKNIDAAS
jgi:hypothetical protein